MDQATWQYISKITDQALDLNQADRRTFVEERCPEADTRSKILHLLQAIDDSEKDQFLDIDKDFPKSLAAELSKDASEYTASLEGEHVGPYTILELIEHGGMGSVYLAERTDGAYHKQVALKILRRGMDTPSNVARFRQERNILANLKHPHIARLLDGGITNQGLPYLVMEYIEGQPLHTYCDTNRLSVKQRLHLLKQVCNTVQFAHQNAIIHRDLKPSNIMVDELGQVKILDFGIAKLIEPDDYKFRYQTQTGAQVITPAYAAPEQFTDTPITTSTDVYNLGIIAFELLCGAQPLDTSQKSISQISEIVTQKRPTRPSKKFQQLPNAKQKSLANARNTTPGQLSRLLKGDLDAIICKAVRKEPNSRYRSVEMLLKDLHNHDHNLPLMAREDTISYRLARLAKRHRLSIAVAALLLFFCIGFGLIYTIQIRQERNQARIEANKAQAVSNYLVDLFESADPGYSKGDTLTALQLLKSGRKRINSLDNQPLVQSHMLEELGNIYRSLSYPEIADSLLRQSLVLGRSIYQPGQPDLSSIYLSLSQNQHLLGNYETSLTLIDTVLQFEQRDDQQSALLAARALQEKAENLKELGKLDSAYQAGMQSLAVHRTLSDTVNQYFLRAKIAQGEILAEMGRFSKAKRSWEQAYQVSKQVYSAPHPEIVNCINGLARVCKELNQYERSQQLYAMSLSMNSELYDGDHLNIAVTYNNLAGTYYYTERYTEADSLYHLAYDILVDKLGQQHPYTVSTLYNRANLNTDVGNYTEAKKMYQKVIMLDEAKFGKEHPNVASDYTGLATLYKSQAKYDSAATYYRKSLEIRGAVYENPNHPYIAFNLRSLAEVKALSGNTVEAKKLFKSALHALSDTYDKNHPEITETVTLYTRLIENANLPALLDADTTHKSEQ